MRAYIVTMQGRTHYDYDTYTKNREGHFVKAESPPIASVRPPKSFIRYSRTEAEKLYKELSETFAKTTSKYTAPDYIDLYIQEIELGDKR